MTERIKNKLCREELNDMECKFNGNRYLTRGIKDEIPVEIQLIMWAIIDNRKAIKADLDYLQIFQLTPQGNEQKILHSQEQPEYSNEILVPLICFPVERRIWVIDSGEYSTMLLPEEY
jgi:hypothetical protein